MRNFGKQIVASLPPLFLLLLGFGLMLVSTRVAVDKTNAIILFLVANIIFAAAMWWVVVTPRFEIHAVVLPALCIATPIHLLTEVKNKPGFWHHVIFITVFGLFGVMCIVHDHKRRLYKRDLKARRQAAWDKYMSTTDTDAHVAAAEAVRVLDIEARERGVSHLELI